MPLLPQIIFFDVNYQRLSYFHHATKLVEHNILDRLKFENIHVKEIENMLKKIFFPLKFT